MSRKARKKFDGFEKLKLCREWWQADYDLFSTARATGDALIEMHNDRFIDHGNGNKLELVLTFHGKELRFAGFDQFWSWVIATAKKVDEEKAKHAQA